MLFKKKNQKEQADAPPIASAPASSGNSKQSLFAPALNPNPAWIDFGFGPSQEPEPNTPAPMVEPPPPQELQATGWAPGAPELSSSGWASGPPAEPPINTPFPKNSGWGSKISTPAEASSMPMPPMESFTEPAWPTTEPQPASSMPLWEEPAQSFAEPSQTYPAEMFDNHTASSTSFEATLPDLPSWEPSPAEFSQPMESLTQPMPTAFEPTPFDDFQPNHTHPIDFQAEWNMTPSDPALDFPMPDTTFPATPSLMDYQPEQTGLPTSDSIDFSFPSSEPFMPEIGSSQPADHELWNNLSSPEISVPGEQMPMDPAAFLDSVGDQLYPQDPFSSVGSDLEESAQAFEEAAQFLFPETMGAPLDWSAEDPGDPFEPTPLLDGETVFEPALELGPSFQNETAGFDDISVVDNASNQFDSFITPQSTAGYMAAHEATIPAEPSYHSPSVVPSYPQNIESIQSFEMDDSDNTQTIQLDHSFSQPTISDTSPSSSSLYTPEATGEAPLDSDLAFEPDETVTPTLDLSSNITPGSLYEPSNALDAGFSIEPTDIGNDFLGTPPLEQYTPPPPAEPALEFGTSFEDEFGTGAPSDIPAYEIPDQPIATWDDSLLGDLPMLEQPLANSDEPVAAAEFNPADTWLMEEPLAEPKIQPIAQTDIPSMPSTEYQPLNMANEPLATTTDDDFYAVSFTLNEQGELVPDHGESTAPIDATYLAPSLASSAQTFSPPDMPEHMVPQPISMSAPSAQTLPNMETDFFSQPTAPSVEDIALTPPMEQAANYHTAPPLPVELPPAEESISAFEFLHEPEEEATPSDSLAPAGLESFPSEMAPAMPMESDPFFAEEPIVQHLGTPESSLLPPAPPIAPVVPPAVVAMPQHSIQPTTQPERIPVATQAMASKAALQPEPPQASSSGNLTEQWEKPAPVESRPTPQKPAQPQASDFMLGNLEIMSICPLDAEKRLLIIHNSGVFALMGQSGVEQPEISVLKVFENNPIAYQNTFTAVAEGQAGNQGMYVVQVGTWHAIISTFQNKITLHTELG